MNSKPRSGSPIVARGPAMVAPRADRRRAGPRPRVHVNVFVVGAESGRGGRRSPDGDGSDLRMVTRSMARTMVTATPTCVNRAATSRPSAEAYGRDLADLPRAWMGFPHDLPPGEHLVKRASGSSSRSWPRPPLFPEDHPSARGQPVAAGRGDHPRSERPEAAAPGGKSRPTVCCAKRSMPTAARCCITAQRPSNAPLTRPAVNSTAISIVTLRAEFGNDPQILRTNHVVRGTACGACRT